MNVWNNFLLVFILNLFACNVGIAKELHGKWKCVEEFELLENDLKYLHDYELLINELTNRIDHVGFLTVTNVSTNVKSKFKFVMEVEQSVNGNKIEFKALKSNVEIIQDPLNYMTNEMLVAFETIPEKQQATFEFPSPNVLRTTYTDGKVIDCKRMDET